MEQQRERNESFYGQKWVLFTISLEMLIGISNLLIELVYESIAGGYFKYVSYMV